MENSKRPAFSNANASDTVTTIENYGGLTKREMAAFMAMQGLLANGYDRDVVPTYAVEQADLLLKELDK